MVKVVTAISEYNSDAAIGKQAVAYTAFVRGKENAGQERALSVPVFVANKVDLVSYPAAKPAGYSENP